MKELPGKNDQFLQAATDGNVSTMKELLERGVDIQTRGLRDLRHTTALHLASRNGKQTAVQFLLSQRADVHAKDMHGETPLLHGAISRNKQIVQLLLEHGADIESKNTNGNTALIYTASNGYQDMVQLLLEHCLNIESKQTRVLTD